MCQILPDINLLATCDLLSPDVLRKVLASEVFKNEFR